MRVLQGIIHRSKTADSLLEQLIRKEEIDDLILGEQYRNRRTAAIWDARTSRPNVDCQGSDKRYIVVDKGWRGHLAGCYLIPSDKMNPSYSSMHFYRTDFRWFFSHWIKSSKSGQNQRVLNIFSQDLIYFDVKTIEKVAQPSTKTRRKILWLKCKQDALVSRSVELHALVG